MNDDLFDQSPQEKFYEILFHANQDAVTKEVESLIERLAALEMLHDANSEEELDAKLAHIQFDQSEQFAAKKEGLYLHYMSNILSQNG